MLIPKQVKCIKSAGSFVAKHTYYVSLTGCVFWGSGNPSGVYWDDSMFEPIYTEQELLEYAAKMYPIGTEYRCASDNEVRKAEYLPKMYNGSVEVGIGFVYLKRKNIWAEIVSEPEKEECFLMELDPWRSLVGYEVVNTITGERSVIEQHGGGGAAKISSGKCIDIHNSAHPHNMINKEWRVFDKAPDKETPLQRCNEIFKVGNIIRSVLGNKFVIEEKHLPFRESGGRIYTSQSNALLYENGAYAAYVGDTEPIKPEPKFKEGDPVICSWHPNVTQFTIVGCQYNIAMRQHIYLISAPGFDGHNGINMTDVIYGKSQDTNSCTWVLEDKLELDATRKGYFTGTDSIFENISLFGLGGGIDFANEHERSVTVTRHVQDQYDLTQHQIQQLIRDSEDDLMWGKDKADLLEVPPLRVSRKNIVK